VAAANLLAAHNFSAEAEEGYRLATQLYPGNPESVSALAGLLANSGRGSEARQLLDAFALQYPDQLKDLKKLSAAAHVIWTAPGSSP